ncbi:hypothetical protein ANCCAN_16803, partial [Ancylostoma caninum]
LGRFRSPTTQALPEPSPPNKATKTVSFSDPLEQHHSPEGRDSALTDGNEGYTYIHESQLKENQAEKRRYNKNKRSARCKILSKMNTVLTEASTSSAGQQNFWTDGQEPTFYDTDYSLYEAHPPKKFPRAASRFYHDGDSMDSYGTITSQEILEAFAQASEELTLASLTNLGNPPPPCVDDSYLYTDLVHLSSPNTTYV